METIKKLAEKIYNQNQYPQVYMYSINQIISVILYYLQAVKEFNEFFQKTSPDEQNVFLSDKFIRFIYEKLEPSGKKNIQLRDFIWICLALIKQHAEKEPEFIPIWKGYIDIGKLVAPIEKKADTKKTIMYAGLGLLAILFLTGKKK
jgi:hypothetical protein